MEFGKLSFDKLLMRYYLMMAIVIGAFFMNAPWLSLIAVPVFILALIGADFTNFKEVLFKEIQDYPETELKMS